MQTCLMAALMFCAFAIPAAADPKEAIEITGDSPFAACLSDTPDAQWGNVYIGSEVEPWIAIDPANSDHWIATWQQDRWSTGGARGLVTAVTFDGGRNWAHVVMPDLTPCSGGSTFLRASDPWLDFAPNGDVYHISLVVDAMLIDWLEGLSGEGRSAMLVQKSTNGGLTWSAPVAIVDQTFNGLNDKESITADPCDANYVYAVWDHLDYSTPGIVDGPTMFVRTTDGGVTWEAPMVLYNPGSNAQTVGNRILVSPDSTLNAFMIRDTVEQVGNMEVDLFELVVAQSQDHGATWSAPVTIASVEPNGVIEPDSGLPLRAGDFLYDVAVDPGSGTLYAVWQDGRFSDFTYESIAMSLSTDGGATWTEPVQVNQTPQDLPAAQQQAFLPAVAANGKGDAAVTYYDFRFNLPGPPASTDVWAVTCRPEPHNTCADPSNWNSELRLTEDSFDISTAPFDAGFFLGDYTGLAADRDDFVAGFPVSHPSDPANLNIRRFGKTPTVAARSQSKTPTNPGAAAHQNIQPSPSLPHRPPTTF